jgi:hypothetical protein
MAFIVADRVQETSTSPGGTGTINLAGAVTGFKSFATGVGTGNTTYYCIVDNSTGAWEVGTGTYTTGSPNTLSRTTVYSNSAGTTANISFTNGNTLTVFCTYPATRGILANPSNNYTGDFTNATLLSRNAFQTSTANSATGIYALPSGTGTAASWQATNAADPTNASKILIATNASTDVQLVSGVNGSGTYLPLAFYNNNVGRFVIGTSGQFGIGPTASVNYGTTGQLFTSGGASAAPTWTSVTGSGNIVSATSPTITNLTLAAGTTSLAPLVMTSGTSLTSPVAGAIEFDGSTFFSTDDVTDGRGYIPSIHFFRLTSDGSAITTIANFFGTSAVSLDNNIFYEVEAYLYFTKTTAGTATFTMTFTQGPVNNNAHYVGTPVGGVGTAGTAQTAAITKSTATAGALPATGTLTTAVNHQYVLRSMFQANATTGGTLNLQVTSSAGSITPLTGSYFKVTRLPATNTGAFS